VARAASSRRSSRRPTPSSVQHDRLFNNGSNGPLTCGGLHERLSLEGGFRGPVVGSARAFGSPPPPPLFKPRDHSLGLLAGGAHARAPRP
jgi:hypothetical protein